MQIEGKNPVLETLRACNKLDELLINSSMKRDEKLKEILKLAKRQKIKVKFKNIKTISKMAKTMVHQGIIAFRDQKKSDMFDFEALINDDLDNNRHPFYIYIRDVFNEYNVGSIVRSAEASGVTGVIMPPKIILTPQMVRASMGGTEHVPIINHALFDAIKIAKKYDIQIVAIEVTGENYYFEEDLKAPMMFIVGGEDRSVSDSITSKCDTVVKIPLLGELNSLNMSTAASLVMYEKVRQIMSL